MVMVVCMIVLVFVVVVITAAGCMGRWGRVVAFGLAASRIRIMVGLIMVIAAAPAGLGRDFVYRDLMGLMMVVMTSADGAAFVHG